jgi:hypothetical protein
MPQICPILMAQTTVILANMGELVLINIEMHLVHG